MIFHADGSAVLFHFIRPEFLIALFQSRAISLIRQDCQSDKNDGKLPLVNIRQPHLGEVERSLGLSAEFLKNQAEAIVALRDRRFIMCWTFEPNGHMRHAYGEDGTRCEIHASELVLMRMLGYERPGGAEFPPRRRKFNEVPGAYGTVQLIPASYSDGAAAVPVVPSYFATATKKQEFAVEAELHVEALIEPHDVVIAPECRLVRWGLAHFEGLSVRIGAKVLPKVAAMISALASDCGVAASGASAK